MIRSTVRPQPGEIVGDNTPDVGSFPAQLFMFLNRG